jgi:hypothetical protein
MEFVPYGQQPYCYACATTRLLNENYFQCNVVCHDMQSMNNDYFFLTFSDYEIVKFCFVNVALESSMMEDFSKFSQIT